jgi:hypothetical protein
LNPNLPSIGQICGCPDIAGPIRSENLCAVVGNLQQASTIISGVVREMTWCVPEYVSNTTLIECYRSSALLGLLIPKPTPDPTD